MKKIKLIRIKGIQTTSWRVCPECGGSGYDWYGGQCDRCGGTGEVD